MHFVKMHGCANDFVVTHDVAPAPLPALLERVRFLCDRRYGIGADGVVLVQPSDKADMRMRIINADGSEAEMCGNGIRCAHVYARSKGLTTADTLVFETGAGPVTTELRGDSVRVTMGAPKIGRAHV
jgi:diaminopimelate epimerase